MTCDLKRGGARVQRDAVAVFDEARRLRSDERFLGFMETGPNLEGKLRAAAADTDGTPMRAEDAPFPLEYREVLSNRDFRNRQALAEVNDRRACVFLDHASDGLTPLSGVLTTFDCFRLSSNSGTLNPLERSVKPEDGAAGSCAPNELNRCCHHHLSSRARSVPPVSSSASSSAMSAADSVKSKMWAFSSIRFRCVDLGITMRLRCRHHLSSTCAGVRPIREASRFTVSFPRWRPVPRGL